MKVPNDAQNQDGDNLHLCLLGGWLFFPLYLIGIIFVARFIPPPAPTLSGEEITALFDLHQFRLLVAMAICVIATALYVPWSVALHGVMSKLEGGSRPLALTQLASGAVGAVFFMITPMVWATMAYRGGHNPDTMLLLNDFAWISWIISWPFFLVQEFAFGLAIFRSRSELLPRWLAYYSLMGSSTLIPATLILFFKSGPFSWNGIFGIYLPLALFAIWFNLVTYLSYRGLSKYRSTSTTEAMSNPSIGRASPA